MQANVTMALDKPGIGTEGLPAPRDGKEAHQRLDETVRRIEAYGDKSVWIHRLSRGEMETYLEAAIAHRTAGAAQPLFGLTFAIKDNIDLAGAPTTAACPDFSYTPNRSATAVQKLIDAGAIPVGKANMDQFATGLVGVRSPYGAVKNPFNPAYISGGSSSGSAVAVAAGLVDFSLGTDTAGSGRVPAAFCNLVGVKPTRGLVSASGVVPACRSLDCVSIFARNCVEAAAILKVVEGFDPSDPYARRKCDVARGGRDEVAVELFQFGVPQDWQLDFFGNHDAEWLYRRAIKQAVNIGGIPVAIDYAPFREAAELLYQGPWVAERFLACRELMQRSPESLLPVTREIISSASRYSAADAFEAQYKLMTLRRRAEEQWQKIDTLMLPTTGTIYSIAEVEAEPIRLNTNLGYYTNFVNLLDLCAVAVPNGFQPDGLPAGVTFMAPAGMDEWLLRIGRRFETPAEEGLT